MIDRLLLVGMSGAGKSTVGTIAASMLGWRFVDMDDAIEQMAGRTVPEIFAQNGEPAFRAMEAELLEQLLQENQLVISSGGGAVCNENAQTMITGSSATLSVWLHTDAEILWERVSAHDDAIRTTARPMLDGENPLNRTRSLLASRERFYGAADVTISVGHRSSDCTARDLEELVRLANGGSSKVDLDTGAMKSRIVVGQGVADSLPQVIADLWPKAQGIWIGVDSNVARLHCPWIEELRARIPLRIHLHEIPSGEASKSLDSYGLVLDWMLRGGVQRGDVAVAIGGGVVGDLMGFVAATVLRGIGLIQIPTTLLSMVDSSVGGKTGINHSVGKNLIGAFYQPPAVLVDTRFLRTLPQRELQSGFAEVIKHGVIQASTPGGESGFLCSVLQLNVDNLMALHEPLVSWVVRQNIRLKASVVAEDEREANLRQILNFGHTIGHGVEAAGYRLLHGEAVAVGMIAAARIAEACGSVSSGFVQSLVDLIESYHLPTKADANSQEVLAIMQNDKKKSAGKQNWILPQEAGGVYVTSDVDESSVVSVIRDIIAE